MGNVLTANVVSSPMKYSLGSYGTSLTNRPGANGKPAGTERAVIGVEQAIALLLHWFWRLRIRCDIRDDTHEAFLKLGRAIMCWRSLKLNALS